MVRIVCNESTTTLVCFSSECIFSKSPAGGVAEVDLAFLGANWELLVLEVRFFVAIVKNSETESSRNTTYQYIVVAFVTATLLMKFPSLRSDP